MEKPSASELWRQAVERAGAPVTEWVPEEIWVPEEAEPGEVTGGTDTSGAGAAGAPRSSVTRATAGRPRDLATREGTAAPGGRRRKVPRPVVDELSAAAGPDRGAKLAARIADATYAYERDRFAEARRILRPLSEEVPASAAVRELLGLVLYRTGQWVQAVKQLEAYKSLSGSFDQHPVLADCYRALHRYDDAEALWEELRASSPSGDLVAEGRIVAAGCRADQGDLAGAIALLEAGVRRVKHPQDRHLRQWYALADLYERAGDVPRARDLFSRIARADPEAFDVRQRVRALR